MTVRALDGLRIVEIAGPCTGYAGKLLADLGADVILVEPPEGVAGRWRESYIAPAATAAQPSEAAACLSFAYLNTNKRSVVLDLEQAAGQRQLAALLANAAAVVHDLPPGRGGIDLAGVAAQHPHLVVVAISPFGQDGPYAGYQASDLTLLAMGGLLSLGGYPDGSPQRAAGNQALLAAGQFAAVGTLLAVLDAEATGRGQVVDVSAQECVVAALETAAQYWDLEQVVRKRTGGARGDPGSGVLPCGDGYVYMTARFGPATGYWQRLVDWLVDEGVPGAEELQQPRWTDPAFIKTSEAKQRFADIFLPFSMAHTRAELYEAASKRELPFSPINSPAEVLASAQLTAREYFVPAPDLGGAAMPGAPYKLSATPWTLRQPAPALGAHTAEVLGRLEDPALARPAAPGGPGQSSARRGPLSGIRVADFTWHGAGSFTTRMLADHGAEVIKFESSARIDSLRLMPPFKDRAQQGSANRSGYFAERNANKRSVSLNLKHPSAREVAFRLIAQSDIVANNFAPGTMERFGLGYDAVRAQKPDVIYLAMSMQGATGPDRLNSGYGLTISALSGLHHLSGLPEREPVGTGTNYSDHIPAPCHATVAVLAALRHRRRTGQGQYIELSQTEAMVSCLGPAMLDYSVNGHIQQRMGNRTPVHAPSGVYPCAGDDCWIALSVADDAEWQALLGVLGATELAGDGRFATFADRQAQQAELDGLLAERTRAWERYALMAALQAAGVTAGVVQTAEDVMDRDPQLRANGHWVTLAHPEMGACRYGAPPFHLGAYPEERLQQAAPLLGQHTLEVCVDLLGYSAEEVARMQADGVLM